jgi:putative aminopeptidase FrvX
MRIQFILLLAAFGMAAQESVRVRLAGQDWLIDSLRELPLENPARQARLKELFEKAGCKDDKLVMQEVKRSREQNVICTLPGESSDLILVGAHFDKVKIGKGTADNGTGMVLLPALYLALSDQPRHHTFVFAGFTDEEMGLFGSRAYARAVPKEERTRYRAMVNMDTLGLGPATVWQDHSHPKLLEWFEKVGGSLQLQNFRYVNVGQVGDSDSSSFKNINVPVIDFHSITPETFKVLHSDLDNINAIKPGDYFQSYRLIAYYLAYLDLQLKANPELKK